MDLDLVRYNGTAYVLWIHDHTTKSIEVGAILPFHLTSVKGGGPNPLRVSFCFGGETYDCLAKTREARNAFLAQLATFLMPPSTPAQEPVASSNEQKAQEQSTASANAEVEKARADYEAASAEATAPVLQKSIDTATVE